MNIQIVNISYQDVFKKYSSKYNIFRDLYEKDLLGLEIRNFDYDLSEKVRRIFLDNREICYTNNILSQNTVDFLALGSFSVLKELAHEILSASNEDLGYKIARTFRNISEYDSNFFKLANKEFPLDQPYIMGILNVTPDSFSDGGKFYEHDNAVNHGIGMLKEGADIIDVGGESTRPGSEKVEESEEINRIIPVIRGILESEPEALISVDTTKSKVAEEALKAGARIVNDISGGTFDENILMVVKEHDASLVLMHIKGEPKNMQKAPFYDDVVSEVFDFLSERTDVAEKLGIKNLFIDPGIGFGKGVSDNYELLKRLDEFKGIGYPILVGLSRKSFIGKALDINIDERDNATSVAETIAVKNGARILRTHNIKRAIEAKKIINYVNKPELLLNV